MKSSSLLINVKSHHFRRKNIVISKKHHHFQLSTYFCPKIKVQTQTGGTPSWCSYEEIEQYFAKGGAV